MNKFIFHIAFTFCFVLTSYSQQLKTRSDYNLSGPVKKCTVLTSYGKEIYEFNRAGYLEVLTSYFNENDYQKRVYNYTNEVLSELRTEVYEGGVLDHRASIVHLFSTDSLGQMTRELVADYKADLIEQLEYRYDSIHRIKSLTRKNNSGISKTLYHRVVDSLGSYAYSVYTDSILEKHIDSLPSSDSLTFVKEVRYRDELPDYSYERDYDRKGNMVGRRIFRYFFETEKWIVEERVESVYNINRQLIKQKTTEGDKSYIQNYKYQLDGSSYHNWIKQIILPNLTYTTRVIEYYED